MAGQSVNGLTKGTAERILGAVTGLSRSGGEPRPHPSGMESGTLYVFADETPLLGEIRGASPVRAPGVFRYSPSPEANAVANYLRRVG